MIALSVASLFGAPGCTSEEEIAHDRLARLGFMGPLSGGNAQFYATLPYGSHAVLGDSLATPLQALPSSASTSARFSTTSGSSSSRTSVASSTTR